jgi:hypothetical protein
VSVGYGRLRDDYRGVLSCADVVVQDLIERGATKAYALPYPSAGVDGRVKAHWTISFTSPTDPQDAVRRRVRFRHDGCVGCCREQTC